MPLLVALFALTALLYAMVGFGGGSTYNALLVLHGTDYRILPAIALTCNIIVVTGGAWRFWRAGYLRFDRLWPWLILSIPAAWIGGRVAISEVAFVGLLGMALLIAGLQLAFERRRTGEEDGSTGRPITIPVQAGIGGGIGLLSGLVGIGGGIFLAPILYLMRWGSAREIAGTASVFILVNSAAGLAGQLMKLGNLGELGAIGEYWILFPAVLIGGQIGSRLGSSHIPPLFIKRMTALLILYVAIRLLWRWFGLFA